MPRVLAFLMTCLLVVAPLLPVRADAGATFAGQTVTLCADGEVREIVIDANGNPIPPCLLGDHCDNCVILSVPALVDPVALARPVWTAHRVVAVIPALFVSPARLSVPMARGPPIPVS